MAFSDTQRQARNGRKSVRTTVTEFPLEASATEMEESWPTQAIRSPDELKLTLCTQPPNFRNKKAIRQLEVFNV